MMDKQPEQQAAKNERLSYSGERMIVEAVESFFGSSSGETIDYLESMLYEWYQHHAQERYNIEHINEVVNNAFRVNDLLLKLQDAMVALRLEQEPDTGQIRTEAQDFRKAS